MIRNVTSSLLLPLLCASCVDFRGPTLSEGAEKFVPAEAFSKSIGEGNQKKFSVFRAARAHDEKMAAHGSDQAVAGVIPASQQEEQFSGDDRWLKQGFRLKHTVNVPSPTYVHDGGGVDANGMDPAAALPPHPPQLPPGSASPYARGQMAVNPSLWPDENRGAFLFRDFRAFEAMDIISVLINERSEGIKRADTEAKAKFSLVAALTNFFGFETAWKSNNEGFDPTAVVSATTEQNFRGQGLTSRLGQLRAQVSAVIMEVLPNGLMRIEGSKIVAVNAEEEVMVISGLVRQRDITALNQVDSNAVANMRIDFYGRGSLGEVQSEGWLGRLFRRFYPF